MADAGMRFRELESRNIEGSDRVEVCTTTTAPERRDEALEAIVGRLSLEPQVTAARWKFEETIV